MTSRNIEVRHETMSTESNNSQATLKFGISTPMREGDKGELVLLPPEQPLSYAIAQVCQIWGFPDPTIFGLKISDRYVTEETRKELSGKLVVMHHSPYKVCTEILDKLKFPNTMELGLKDLASKASDPVVAEVFVSEVDGLQVLIDILEKDKLADKEKALAFLLEALLDIIIHSSNANWDKLQPSVISKIVGTVNNSQRGLLQERPALRPALQVLESAVASGYAYSQVDKEIPLANLMQHVQNPDPKVQQNALALLNALLSKAEHSKRKHLASTLTSRKYRDIIIQSVIKKPTDTRPAETNRQLFVLQTHFLNFLDERKQTPVDPQDQESLSRIKDLTKIAFDSDGTTFTFGSNFELNGNNTAKKEKPNFSRDYKKLGFQNVNPVLDFCDAPPGILALDCMHYLATTHTEIYNKLVLETVCRGVGDECPFARASIALTKLLCDTFRIGEPPIDAQGKFYPFIFQYERPFEEFFCICAQLVTKTWKEMKATVEDFDKVFDVVQEQIQRGLSSIGVTVPESLQFTELKAELFQKLTYSEISNLRAQRLKEREGGELQAKPIQELRRKLEPEMMELIKQNRLNYMINGTRFNRYALKGLRVKEKFWFCRLSPNGKIIHYGDCEEKATPLPEELSSKVSVVELQDLKTGKDCQAKDVKKKDMRLAFSLVTGRDPVESIDFVAPDEKTFDLWTDGINALLGKPMMSKEALSDLEILLNMEIKLRLLDIEGIPSIPVDPPLIPELPPNFDFFSNAK